MRFSIFDSNPLASRREFLSVGTLAGLSFLGANAKAAEPRRTLSTDKSVIFLMMHGGPSQFETWDTKPNAPSGIRNVTGDIQTSIPGVTFGRYFPKLARHADMLAIVRSFQTNDGNHTVKPVVSADSLGANIGSLYSRLVGPLRETGMPTNAAVFPSSVDRQGPGPRTSFGNFLASGNLGPASTPFVPGGGGPMMQNMQLAIPRDRLDDRRTLLAQLNEVRRSAEASDAMTEMNRINGQAFDVILGGIASAFDLSREDPRVVAKYDTEKFNRTAAWDHKNNKALYETNAKYLGRQLLLARRLCEAGCGFVLVNTEFVWDMHQDVNNLGVNEGMDLIGTPFDNAVSAFIEDTQARGLDEKILLVASGEMGRTPRVNNGGGRDHWGRLAPLLLYGGGITHGQVIGQSSRDGGEPASTPQRIENLIATVMHTLFDTMAVRLAPGIPNDVSRVITDGRPFPGLLGS